MILGLALVGCRFRSLCCPQADTVARCVRFMYLYNGIDSVYYESTPREMHDWVVGCL